MAPHSSGPLRLRLFCLPNVGAGGAQYYAWSRLLPAGVELCPIQLPGRENRLAEPPFERLDELIETLVEVLGPCLDLPFAIFGHSLGALTAFELARGLRGRYGLTPAQLFVSGRRPPHLPPNLSPIHALPAVQFLRELANRYNGIPDAVLRDRELLTLFLPILRADIAVMESHVWRAGEPLDCPIAVYGGLQDDRAPQADLAAWAPHTTRPVEVKMFKGGHFFHQSARTELLAEMSATLTPLLATLSS